LHEVEGKSGGGSQIESLFGVVDLLLVELVEEVSFWNVEKTVDSRDDRFPFSFIELVIEIHSVGGDTVAESVQDTFTDIMLLSFAKDNNIKQVCGVGDALSFSVLNSKDHSIFSNTIRVSESNLLVVWFWLGEAGFHSPFVV